MAAAARQALGTARFQRFTRVQERSTNLESMSTEPERSRWSSRLAFVLAAVGSSIGLGSIWKFPYMAGMNGGGAFVLIYLLVLAIVILPLLIAEFVIGRRGGKSAVGSLKRVALESGHSPRWGLLGVWGVAAGFLILSFYSVIGGWTLAYIPLSAFGSLKDANADAISAIFAGLLARPGVLTLCHGLFMGATAFIVALGVTEGLERAVRILMPLLLVILLALVIHASVTADFAAAVTFLFQPSFDRITPRVILDAAGLGFFSISVGMGIMITYAAYSQSQTDLTQVAITTLVADTVVSFLAGLAIFPIVFAHGLDPGEGPSLMFVTLPIAFARLPGGELLGVAFFVLLLVSALASAISLLELIVAWLVERGTRRTAAAMVASSSVWLVGLGTVLSFNKWSEFFPLSAVPGFEEKTVFDLLDYFTSNVMLTIGGIFTALFAGYVLDTKAAFAELRWRPGGMGRIWMWLVRILCPVAILAVVIANLLPR